MAMASRVGDFIAPVLRTEAGTGVCTPLRLVVWCKMPVQEELVDGCEEAGLARVVFCYRRDAKIAPSGKSSAAAATSALASLDLHTDILSQSRFNPRKGRAVQVQRQIKNSTGDARAGMHRHGPSNPLGRIRHAVKARLPHTTPCHTYIRSKSLFPTDLPDSTRERPRCRLSQHIS